MGPQDIRRSASLQAHDAEEHALFEMLSEEPGSRLGKPGPWGPDPATEREMEDELCREFEERMDHPTAIGER